MKIYVFTYFLLQVGFAAFSQQAYFKEFENDYSERFYDVAETEDGFIICGETKRNASATNESDGYLVKTDTKGNIIWSKELDENYFERFERILHLNDSYYIVGRTKAQNSNSLRKFWRYSQNGDLLMSLDLGDTTLASFDNRNFKFLDVGNGFIVAGSGSADPTTVTDGELIKLDYNGNILWKKRYNFDIGGFTLDMVNGIKQEENGFILFLHSLTNNTPNHSEHIIKTDFSGNELWRKEVTDYAISNDLALTGMTNRPTAIAPYQNGYVMVVQAQDEFERTFRTYLVQLDENGNEIEVRAFLDSINYTLFNLYTNVENEIFVLGLDMTDYSTDDWGFRHSAFKWGKTGSLLWKKTEGVNFFTNWYSNGMQTNDGGFISVGRIFRYSPPRSNPIIVKRDCQGNIEWDYSSCSIASEQMSLTVFPNPSDGQFLFHLSGKANIECTIYDYFGRKILSKSFNDKDVFEVNLHGFSDGMYHYVISINDETSISGKLIKNSPS